MTQTILILALSYGLLAVTTVFVAFKSSLSFVLRGGLSIAVAVFMLLTYRSIGEIRGWPSDAAPPDNFRLLWAQIAEPDKLTGDPGAIFIWISELDRENYPVGLPRAHKLPFSDELALLISEAQRQVSTGEQIAGQIRESGEIDDTAEALAAEADQQNSQATNTRLGERYLSFDFGNLVLGTAPAPVTPKKQD